MAYDFKELKEKIAEVGRRLSDDYRGVRTGRATPTLLDHVRVESYGTQMAINQVAALSSEDARTLRIVPWDANLSKEIEKAITNANLGVSVSVDGSGLRVSFPKLTGERRKELLKIVNEKLEQARIALRGERDRVWKDIEKREKAKEFGEDEKFRYKEEMEKIVKEGNESLDAIAERKEKEIAQ